jgi:glycosyltransferase involved in cell wall biosynthesis
MVPKVGMASHGRMMALSLLPALRRLRREFDFDLIDAHYVYPDGYAAVCLGKLLGKPVVVSARGTDITLFPEWPAIRKRIKKTLLDADGAIAVSAALKQAMVNLGAPDDKIEVIPNGVDAAKFHPVPRAEARAELDLPAGPTILSVGSLTPNKGTALMIQAVKILVDRHGVDDLNLLIVGEGTMRAELEQLVASLSLERHVRLVGAMPHESLRLWFSAADVFCLASAREGWPNVLLESMACGTPVVATSIWGVPEIVQSEALGTLVERDPESIAEGLHQALRKEWSREGIVAHARERSWSRTADSVAGLFESVLGRQAERSRTARSTA